MRCSVDPESEKNRISLDGDCTPWFIRSHKCPDLTQPDLTNQPTPQKNPNPTEGKVMQEALRLR